MEMETNNKKHIKPFWAFVVVAVCAFIAGGVITWAVYNSNLQEEVMSLVPGKAGYLRTSTTTDSSTKDAKTGIKSTEKAPVKQ